MNVRMRLAVAMGTVAIVVALGYSTVRTWWPHQLSSSSEALMIREARLQYLTLDSVGDLKVENDRVTVSGYWLGWFDFDARRRTLGSVSAPIGPFVLGEETSGEWELGEGHIVRHRRSTSTITLGLPGTRPPTVIRARALSPERQILAIAAGDWKLGPEAYVAIVVVEGKALRRDQ